MNIYKIKDIVSFQNGFAFNSKDMGPTGTNIIKIKEVKNNKITITESTQKISNYDYDSMKKYLVNYNDILIALTGDPTNKGSEESWVGRTAIYREKECALLNQRMCKIIPNTKYILPKYLYYYLISYPTLYTLASSAKGSANQANISHKDVGELDIALPSIEMQQHIVDIIGSLDDKIENNNKLYKKIDEYLLLKYKKIQDKTVKGNFKDNFNILNGYAFKSKDYIEFGTYKVITIKNIKSDGFTTASCDFIDFNDDYRKVKLNVGDILLTMTGDVGRVGIVDQENCLLNQRVLKVTGISPAYTYTFLKSNYYNISMISKGSVQQNLSVNDLYNISVYNSKQQIFEFKKYDSLFEKMIALKKENIKLQQLKSNYLAKFF